MIDTICIQLTVSKNINCEIWRYIFHFLTEENKITYVDVNQFDTSSTQTNRVHAIKRHRVDNNYGDNSYFRGKNFVPSFSNYIDFSYDENKSLLKIQFSVPKIYFGQNVFIALINPFSFDSVDFNHHFEDNYNILLKAIIEVLKSFTFGIITNSVIQSVIITRIDFCFPMVFKTALDVDSYFNSLKSHKKKYSRVLGGNETGLTTYGIETLMYRSKTNTVKFYKKGDEFKKHGFEFLDKKTIGFCKKLQELANRTLRFEQTCRNSYMSRTIRSFERVDSIQQFTSNQKLIDKINNTTLEFSLDVNCESLHYYNSEFDVFNYESLKRRFFYKEIFIILINSSYLKYQEMLIGGLDSNQFLIEKIENHKNNNPFSKIKFQRFIMIYELLKERSLDELVNDGVIHRNTKSNLIKRFKNILGIDILKRGKHVINPPYDLEDYLIYCKLNFMPNDYYIQ